MDSTQTYEIDRVAASKMLKVSTRTIDRYLRNGQLSGRKIRGRVLLSEEEILDLKNGKPYGKVSDEKKSASPISTSIKPHDVDSQFYKDLYEETLKILEEKETRIEQTQYRIGQLESQITSHYPVKTLLPDAAESHSIQILRQNLAENEQTVRLLQTRLKREKFNRHIISAILYVLLLLQPVLWYLLRAGSHNL